jgi:hypothetical protein
MLGGESKHGISAMNHVKGSACFGVTFFKTICLIEASSLSLPPVSENGPSQYAQRRIDTN